MHNIPILQKNKAIDCINFFGCGFAPDRESLVLHDGYDRLEKEDAEKFFAGKSVGDVLDVINSSQGSWGLLESLSVLTPQSFLYYVKPFLIYLITVLENPDIDHDYVSFLFFELTEFFMINGFDFLSLAQKDGFMQLADISIQSASQDGEVKAISKFITCLSGLGGANK